MSTPATTASRFGLGLAALVTATGAGLCAPVPTSASADQCDSSGSCEWVNGAGTYVEYVSPSISLGGNTSMVGHFHIFGGGVDHTTSDDRYWTDNFWGKRADGPTYWVGRDLTDGALLCTSFAERTGGGYRLHSPACVRIHR